MENLAQVISIKKIQGTQLRSPLVGEKIRTRGIVTGVMRRGFFIQTPDVKWDGEASDAVFVFSPDWDALLGNMVEVEGKVVDYQKHELAKPVTQVHLEDARNLKQSDEQTSIKDVLPISLTQQMLAVDSRALALLLNSLEGMLVHIGAGQTFIAPSNPYGDYVLALDADGPDKSTTRTTNHGVLVDLDDPLRWFAGFRFSNYKFAPRLNVGSKLLSAISGPLNYRADSYQITVSEAFEIDTANIKFYKSSLKPESGSVTIMTLNCFNLDPHIESESKVLNPRRDVDDDWGDGRFHTLAQAVVLQANLPDIVAVQEIQDNDGAEISDIVDASETYSMLVKTIEQLSGVTYQWVDVNPEVGADGGQPGGNIRNGYLFNPLRVRLVAGSVRVLGANQSCFDGSRKPLIAKFQEHDTGQIIACINLHLASKRHQNSIFSPIDPGVDTKLSVRIEQAECVAKELQEFNIQGICYYVTGDFNDNEGSETLTAMLADHSVNLVESLPVTERYDYNHRGKLQVLMHGIVPKSMAKNRAVYEIIHGNELIGVVPGKDSDKPSDHAYVITKLALIT